MRIEPINAKTGTHNTTPKDVEALWLDQDISGDELVRLDPLDNDADAIRLADEALGIPQLPAEQPDSIRMLDIWHKIVRDELRATYGPRETAATLYKRLQASS